MIKDAITFAIDSGVVDEDRIGIVGFSMGAYLAFRQAGNDPRVKAVVSVSGSMPLESRAKFPPTLILHGSNDGGTPIRIVRKVEDEFKAKNIPCEVYIYARTGHNFEVPKFIDAGKRAGTFFDKYMKKAKTPPLKEKAPDPSSVK